MIDIKKTLMSLRKEINKYREERGEQYILADILAVEIAVSLVEFCLKKNRAIKTEEEIWFEALYVIAYSFDGTELQNIYTYYKDLVTYVKAHNYFRNEIPQW